MAKGRPARSGYAQLAQAEEENGGPYSDETDDDQLYIPSQSISVSAPRYAPIQPRPRGQLQGPRMASPAPKKRPGTGRQRMRSNSSGVDIKAINARLERWAEEIASKFKRGGGKGKSADEEKIEIHYSVFQPPEGVRPLTAEMLAPDPAPGDSTTMSKDQFDDIVESVKVAIELGIHPKMISQGSSGSYFARNSEGQVVGVFKPKDEEPYASRNPKWTKWIHRNLFPCFFGRACLIPNLSYVSEAAAYVLDTRLRTHLVPYTDIVYFSSKAFYYDYWDRRNYYRKHKPLPAKVGSFQVFLKGFKDANVFLREHPWPDQHNPSFRTEDAPRKVKRPWNETCRPRGAASDDEEESDRRSHATQEEVHRRKFFWTEALQQSFREQLEKLVILDYIMRNTDRGLDNWMIKVDWEKQETSIVSHPPRLNGHPPEDEHEDPPRLIPVDGMVTAGPQPYRRQEPMTADGHSGGGSGHVQGPSIAIGAIDNSLSWPWKHPDAWRSFPFGWLFLPVSLIGQPFSQNTRDHFLPLLTSTAWWSETQAALRAVFSQDSDFQEKMFAKQIAVMKGQAWNVVETLKTRDHGPLELTRRARVCVWDDLVDIPVAVPLKTASLEMRRRREAEARPGIDEEMDISAANASAPLPQHDLLGLSSPNHELPNPHRLGASYTGHQRPLQDSDGSLGKAAPGEAAEGVEPSRSVFPSAGRPGHEGGRSSRRSSLSLGRRLSVSIRRGSGNLSYDGEDLEGDLGYAAAEDMEGNQKKVIVERLETVKARNPVFSWC